jgi:hypothetical protein
MSTQARKYARSEETRLITIWVRSLYHSFTQQTVSGPNIKLVPQEVWPCHLYNLHNVPTNPMRCVHNDTTQQLKFFENMSRAFALKAREFATVLHSSENYATPPKTGIWARVEFPALQSGFVDEVRNFTP